MTNKRIAYFIAPFMFLAVLAGCKKEEKETIEESKLVGSWLKIKLESRTASTSWEVKDEPCQMDNIEEYKSGGDYALYVGTAQCTPGESGVTGTWKEAAGNTKIIYTYSGASGEYESTIEELTSARLVTTHATGDLAGTQLRNTYQKQ